MLNTGEWKELTHVRICGLMGMASNTDNVEQINREFCLLDRLFKAVSYTHLEYQHNTKTQQAENSESQLLRTMFSLIITTNFHFIYYVLIL